MDYSYFNVLETKVQSSSKYIFEPTVNIFKNGVVINHQKVGTRFLNEIVSGNKTSAIHNNKQYQFSFLNSPQNGNYTLNPINYHFSKRYVNSPWTDEGRNYLLEGYPLGINDDFFLKSNGFENYTDFFFNNPKDFYFIIRNPIHRFFSGIIQILSVNSKEITLEEFGKILRENFETVLSDIHTINYLEDYKEMIYNIKDKSKIKIIDLSHLKSNKACEFFCKLRGDNIPKEIYKEINQVDSNKSIYLNLYKLYEEVEENNSIFIQHIRKEYNHYQELKNSQYFLDLS